MGYGVQGLTVCMVIKLIMSTIVLENMGGLLVGYMWYWSRLIVNENIKSSLHGKNTGACSSMLATVNWGKVINLQAHIQRPKRSLSLLMMKSAIIIHKPSLFNTQWPPFFHKKVQKPSASRAREPRKLLFN